MISLELQRVALEHGLILVDTKYEFGKGSDGSVLLIDEVWNYMHFNIHGSPTFFVIAHTHAISHAPCTVKIVVLSRLEILGSYT